MPKLQIAKALTTVNVGYSAEEIATEQVKIEEHQRIFGIIPNFYVAYDQNAAPLTSKLKFQLAAKVAFDPVTFIGVGIASGAEQAGEHPNYREGAIGYAERYGAAYANGFTDILIGGAILPSLLHQDPRYFYQGTGTTKSRVVHAVTSPFVCKARQPAGGRRTIRPWEAIWPQERSRMLTILHRIAASGYFWGISLSEPASVRPPTWRRSSSCAGLPKANIRSRHSRSNA